LIPLEITSANKVPTRIFSRITIFSTVISRRTLREPYFQHLLPEEPRGSRFYRELIARKKAPSRYTCNKIWFI
jgi:hypothetical protein